MCRRSVDRTAMVEHEDGYGVAATAGTANSRIRNRTRRNCLSFKMFGFRRQRPYSLLSWYILAFGCGEIFFLRITTLYHQTNFFFRPPRSSASTQKRSLSTSPTTILAKMAKRKRSTLAHVPANSSSAKTEHDRIQLEQSKQHINSLSGGKIIIPQKRWYRQRAHANPFSDHSLEYPTQPAEMNWGTIYPKYFDAKTGKSKVQEGEGEGEGRKVEFADVGCGFGGLLMQLAPLYPERLMLGLEIRVHVTQYVHDKIVALRLAAQQGRLEQSQSGTHTNTSSAAQEEQGEASTSTLETTTTAEEALNAAAAAQATGGDQEDLDEATANAQLVSSAHLAPDPTTT